MAISNNSGAFGKRTAPATQELVDDIVEDFTETIDIDEPEAELPETESDRPKLPMRQPDWRQASLIAVVAIAAWEILKEIFKD